MLNCLKLITALALLASLNAFGAASDQGSSETSLGSSDTTERHYLLDPVELTPVSGFTVVNGSAGFNLGAYGAYPLLSNAPLYLEPSLILGFYSGNTMFNFSAGARYDLALSGTRIRPFARVALGPTFQTSGTVGVFNASAGGGVIIPFNRDLDFRAEAAMVDIAGDAGVELLGGVSL